MATVTEPVQADPQHVRAGVVLRQVPWEVYVRLRDERENDHVRMAFCDGVLELTLPEYPHEKYARRLGIIIDLVALELGIDYAGAGSTTFRREGPGAKKGVGKEPDTCFYFAHEPLIRDKDQIDLETDPPPDLVIEVDNTNDSRRALPIYARMGVPEVWRYDVDTETLWFGALQPDGSYAPLDRSLALPMLTPGLVLEQLRRCVGVSEGQWGRSVRDWVRDTLMPRPEP
ncbi:MAG TPA: Uma2 family endonuclease [Isosphaeraceae bacterium]|jgi:Uma2 family endonuclease|nr:Uma2 family endonuclease [Isosphaeraceae bacterium]